MTTDADGSPTGNLTSKQQAFCEEYLVDLNATQAAIRAGYSEKTAKEIGFENLTKPHIAEEVQRLMSERSKRTEVTGDRIILELASMAFYDPAELGEIGINGPEDIKKLTEEVRRAIVGWSWDKAGNFTLKISDKIRALDLLGQHRGLWKNKIEITGKDGGPIQTSLEDATIRQAEELAEFISEMRSAIIDPRERAVILERMPEASREMAKQLEDCAAIAAKVTPPASFRGMGSQENNQDFYPDTQA